jgi:hypothetical protein
LKDIEILWSEKNGKISLTFPDGVEFATANVREALYFLYCWRQSYPLKHRARRPSRTSKKG